MQFARLPDMRGQRGACSIPEAPSHFVGPGPEEGYSVYVTSMDLISILALVLL